MRMLVLAAASFVGLATFLVLLATNVIGDPLTAAILAPCIALAVLFLAAFTGVRRAVLRLQPGVGDRHEGCDGAGASTRRAGARRGRVTIVERDGSDLVARPGRVDATPSEATASRPRSVRAALVAVVLLPIVVAVVRALRHDWFPIGDSALLYIRARDVAHRAPPVARLVDLGVAERRRAHEQPRAAVRRPARADRPAAAVLVGGGASPSGAVNAACVARHLGGVAGRSAAGRCSAGCCVACAAMSWVLGSELLIDIWQAHALLLPFLLYLVLMIGLACGQARWLPCRRRRGVGARADPHQLRVRADRRHRRPRSPCCAATRWPPGSWRVAAGAALAG